MKNFTKTMKTAPATARTFENGDVSVKADEYVKGQPMFGYYKPTKNGFALEKLCFSGRAASSYNWAKCNNPNFVPSSKFEKVKPKRTTESKLLAKLDHDLKNNPERFQQDTNPLPLSKKDKATITKIANPKQPKLKVLPKLFDQV